MTVSTAFYLRSIIDQREREDIDDGIIAAVRQFYADYEDATSIIECDASFYRALEMIAGYGATNDLDNLIAQAQESITSDSGRKFADWLDL